MHCRKTLLLKALGALLLLAAVSKGWQLLAEPLANNDFWSSRPFLIFQVEFELALAIWLLSALFKKAAWFAALFCFGMFSCVTLYKGLTGAASCGCFGSVHVNPWITLLAIDLPAVAGLAIFRPVFSRTPGMSSLRRESIRYQIKALAHEFITPLPSSSHFAAATCIGILAIGVTTPILVLRDPPMITSTYEVLEPEAWIGKQLPILKYTDIGPLLKRGNWLILLYHHNCSDCATAISLYEQMARDLAKSKDFLQIALIEIPPYGHNQASRDSPCTLGRLDDAKEWFVTTPAVAILANGRVISAWEAKAPDPGTVVQVVGVK